STSATQISCSATTSRPSSGIRPAFFCILFSISVSVTLRTELISGGFSDPRTPITTSALPDGPAQPSCQNVSRSIDVPIQNEPTVPTAVDPLRQRLGDIFAAP